MSDLIANLRSYATKYANDYGYCVASDLDKAADRIEALEEGAHRLNRKIEWWEDKYRQQACRAEALEAALRAISREMPSDSADKLRRIARAATAGINA